MVVKCQVKSAAYFLIFLKVLLIALKVRFKILHAIHNYIEDNYLLEMVSIQRWSH